VEQDKHDKSKSSGARRRFLGVGAKAGPALLTLASQPALAVTCFTPSRSLSKNMSVSQAGKNGDCNGVSPGNYAAQTTPGHSAYNWPSAVPPSTAFHSVFSGSRFVVVVGNGPTTRSLTMLEVLKLPQAVSGITVTLPTDPSNVAMHLIGAYLNVVNLLIPSNILDTDGVKTIWTEWNTKGYYEPVAGVQWNAAAIVLYLTSNGIAP
jgi:hypothetical protein